MDGLKDTLLTELKSIAEYLYIPVDSKSSENAAANIATEDGGENGGGRVDQLVIDDEKEMGQLGDEMNEHWKGTEKDDVNFFEAVDDLEVERSYHQRILQTSNTEKIVGRSAVLKMLHMYADGVSGVSEGGKEEEFYVSGDEDEEESLSDGTEEGTDEEDEEERRDSDRRDSRRRRRSSLKTVRKIVFPNSGSMRSLHSAGKETVRVPSLLFFLFV